MVQGIPYFIGSSPFIGQGNPFRSLNKLLYKNYTLSCTLLVSKRKEIVEIGALFKNISDKLN